MAEGTRSIQVLTAFGKESATVLVVLTLRVAHVGATASFLGSKKQNAPAVAQQSRI